MRGIILLLTPGTTRSVDADVLRASGLLVYEEVQAIDALEQVGRSNPDVIVTVLAHDQAPSIVRDLRRSAE